jgi:hypothetical protein
MYFWNKALFSVMTLVLSVALVAAQDQCPTIVQSAVEVLANDCAGMERNQACYGNGEIISVAQPDAALSFEAPGDIDDLANFESMALSPLDEDSGAWGVALLQVQADLPDTLPGQNVSVLLFGDVEITNAGEAMEAFYFRSGVGMADCAEAPDGIVIQTPEGAGMVSLTINSVEIELGSTAYITAEPEGLLTFALLEGEADVTAIDKTVTVEAGQYTQMGMSVDLAPVDTPSEPKAIEGNLELPDLPLDALPQPGEDRSETASAADVIPLSGSWLFTLGEISIGGDCANVMTEGMIRQGLQQSGVSDGVTFEAEFEGDFTMGEWFSSIEASGMTYTTDNPEPGVYTVQLTAEGVTIDYTFTAVSETEITGEIVQNIAVPNMSCSVTMDFTMQYQD